MKSWLLLLGGMLVWTVHFFGVYAIAEIAPRAWPVVALTVLAVATDLWLLRHIRREPDSAGFSGWRRSVALGGAALSLVAVTWQGLPAMLSS
ncbi:MAG: hypothetical protein WBL20_16760 [Sphingobium sp.]|jgi:hypothetical protein|nr:MAG: hypothetical protein DI537_36115 [Stutzerimonas stutzeri]